MDVKLKECPCCKNEDIILNKKVEQYECSADDEYFVINCLECDLEMRSRVISRETRFTEAFIQQKLEQYKLDLIEKWNSRQ
uniref:Putative restriction alleviation protein n=1 Tax=viral metagenome TaxID=1070528 RepID=A0A6M3M4C2_9ZZZZ